MKRMMVLMLGLAIAIGTTASAFAQDAPQKTEKKKKGGKKKNKEDKTEKKS